MFTGESTITGHRGRRHYCISIFARGGARACNVINLWPKADDFFWPLFGHLWPNGYRYFDQWPKVAKKAPYM